MSVVELLRVWRARWRVVAAVFSLCVTASALLSLAATPLYASSTDLFVSTATDSDVEVYQGSLYSVQRVKSYQQLAQSVDTARSVVDQLGLSTRAEDLRDEVTATVVPDTTVLRLSVSDPSAARAQALASTYAEVLVASITELETPSGSSTPRVKVEVTDAADLPDHPYSPNVLIRLFIGAFLGVVLGLTLAVLRHLLDNRVRDPEEAARLAETSLLAVIGRVSSSRASGTGPSEALRTLRTNFTFARAGRAHGVYVMASPVSGDGKTTIAEELARAVALTGRTVLLIDADLRRPSVAERLGLDGETGLTTILVGESTLAESVQPTDQVGLSALTSGRLPPNPSELMQAESMAELLTQLRQAYDVVVMDAAPLLPVTDTAVLASQCDGTVLVARHGVTTRHQLTLARGRLDAVGAPVLGVVLNFAPLDRSDGYGYGYGYGYSADPGAVAPASAGDGDGPAPVAPEQNDVPADAPRESVEPAPPQPIVQR